jgi:hypothetical protein
MGAGMGAVRLPYPERSGGDEGARTLDLRIANATLYQTELRPHMAQNSRVWRSL